MSKRTMSWRETTRRRSLVRQVVLLGWAPGRSYRGHGSMRLQSPNFYSVGSRITARKIVGMRSSRGRRHRCLRSIIREQGNKMEWAYGVTTIPSRANNLLPRTLASLAGGGFPKPRLFIDGAGDTDLYRPLGLETTTHYPNLRIFGNWILSLWELYIRNPAVHRYAIFQDDFVTYRNLRGYLERCKYPERGYWNLYTFPVNQKQIPQNRMGWHLSNQRGKGAVALVFSLEAVIALLSQPHIVGRPRNLVRGWRAVDGGVVTALRKAGWREYVHNPSLVQHTGAVSSVQNKSHPLAPSFRGEGFDAMKLL